MFQLVLKLLTLYAISSAIEIFSQCGSVLRSYRFSKENVGMGAVGFRFHVIGIGIGIGARHRH